MIPGRKFPAEGACVRERRHPPELPEGSVSAARAEGSLRRFVWLRPMPAVCGLRLRSPFVMLGFGADERDDAFGDRGAE